MTNHICVNTLYTLNGRRLRELHQAEERAIRLQTALEVFLSDAKAASLHLLWSKGDFWVSELEEVLLGDEETG